MLDIKKDGCYNVEKVGRWGDVGEKDKENYYYVCSCGIYRSIDNLLHCNKASLLEKLLSAEPTPQTK